MKQERRQKRSFFDRRWVHPERRRFNNWALVAFGSAALAIFLHQYVIGLGVVSERSMLPTLPVGSSYLIHKYHYRWSLPQRGDIVIFRGPDEPRDLYVKRVIALPGDTLEIVRNQVIINGRPLPEPYAKGLTYPPTSPSRMEKGTCFVLGDNREESFDSRTFGPIPISSLEGKIAP
ncbi:MAG: signal peptidase I [Candidatus Omnitrophica bacterium]|nr:signal peptidase I [Candidatus Omnitrophota bacterium]